MFSPCFFVKFVFSTAAILCTVYNRPMKHALRQTANLPNQGLFVPAVLSYSKANIHPHLIGTSSRSVQVIIVVFESRKAIPDFFW